MSSTTPRAPEESPWYPLHVSARADELIDELGEVQCRRLFDALRTTSVAQWLCWLEDARAEIGAYDGLTAKQRKRRLQDPGDIDALRLHHACVFVELWRARMERNYRQLPPRGMPLDRPEDHRSMLLDAMAAHSAWQDLDLWPFERHLQEEWRLPFDPD
ncbi:MAG: hypothetical protein RLY71_455 [Pseudomonadota bacterium]|jgi:hypothetical protein